MGEERATALWRELGDFEMVLVRADGSVAVTAGLSEQFVLAQGYENRVLEVIAP